jgi:hypothetical protein
MRGERTGIVVELDAGHDQVAKVLADSGLAVRVDGQRLHVDVAGTTDDPWFIHDQVRDAVAAAGVGLRRLTDQTLSLEDVFLESAATPDSSVWQ